MPIDAHNPNRAIPRSDRTEDLKAIHFRISTYVNPTFVNVWSMGQALRSIEVALKAHRGFRFFTLNLDHLCKLQRYPTFRLLYESADFVGADGWPVAIFARRRGAPVLRVPGSELIDPLCDIASNNDWPVFFFGTTTAALQAASANLQIRYPKLRVAGQVSPPIDFDPRSELAADYAETIATSGARVCFVALGAPKQEAFTDFAKATCPSVGFICIGAGLDFIAGTQKRAPKLIRRLKMEWAWRWGASPRRLTGRYIECIRMFFTLLKSRVKED